MRVLYDLSVIGLAAHNDRARTGVYRAVDRVARHLALRDDLDLSWTAFAHHEHLDGLSKIEPFPGFDRHPVIASWGRHQWVAAVAHWNDRVGAIGYGLGRVTEPLRWMLRQQMQRPQLTKEQLVGVDIFHSPFHQLPSWSQSIEGPIRVLSVYDLIPMRFPQWFEAGEPESFRRKLQSINRRDWVICCSESTRNDLLEFRDDLDPHQVRVIPLAAPASFQPCRDDRAIDAFRERIGLPTEAPYFLSLCTLEPRKNLRHLIAAFDELTRTTDSDPYLVLVGTPGWKFDGILADIAQKGRDRIITTGFLPDHDLPAVYSGATAFVYVSLYEGFGLPPLEAMSCGVPVVASDNSSLPEVVGDAGMVVDTDDRDALVDSMRRLLDSPELCRQYSDAGRKRADGFSWDRCGEATVDVYRDAIESRHESGASS